MKYIVCVSVHESRGARKDFRKKILADFKIVVAVHLSFVTLFLIYFEVLPHGINELWFYGSTKRHPMTLFYTILYPWLILR